MPEHLTQNTSYANNGNVPISPIQHIEYGHILSKRTPHKQDTIAAAQKQEKKQARVGQRPFLPPPGKSKNPNYLAIVSLALEKAFDAMAEGTIQQTKSYADLQQLDETLSQSVLLSTKHMIDKEREQIKLAAKVEEYQKKYAKQNKIFGDVMLAIGILLIVATIASAAFDAGASLAAVPEEVSLFGEDADVELDTFSKPPDEGEDEGSVSDADEDDGAAASGMDDATDIQETDQVTNTEKDTTNELDQSNKEDSKSEESFKEKSLKWLGKKSVQIAGAVALGSPMLMKGIQGLKTARMLHKTAAAQKQVGNAISVMRENNGYFQFYQHLLTRASSVATEETNNASEVVETFAQITNAYQQISYGLANAV